MHTLVSYSRPSLCQSVTDFTDSGIHTLVTVGLLCQSVTDFSGHTHSSYSRPSLRQCQLVQTSAGMHTLVTVGLLCVSVSYRLHAGMHTLVSVGLLSLCVSYRLHAGTLTLVSVFNCLLTVSVRCRLQVARDGHEQCSFSLQVPSLTHTCSSVSGSLCYRLSDVCAQADRAANSFSLMKLVSVQCWMKLPQALSVSLSSFLS